MVEYRNLAKRGAALALSGTLALAFSPLAFAPQALAAASEENVNAVVGIIKIYDEGAGSAVTERGAEDIISAMDKYGVEVSDLPEAYQLYAVRCQLFAAQSDLDEANSELSTLRSENQKLQKQVTRLKKQLATAQGKVAKNEAQAIKTQVKITSFKAAAAGMGKVSLSWKTTGSVTGLRYQISYKAGSGKASTTSTKATSKRLSLAGGKTYVFQVRPYKKVSGKAVYGKASKKLSVKVPPVYKAGTYKVIADMLHMRSQTSVSSDLLVDIKNGTSVKVAKLKVASGVVWGQVTYGGKTGWVQMQYLKKA